jgi:hypothetical protein
LQEAHFCRKFGFNGTGYILARSNCANVRYEGSGLPQEKSPYSKKECRSITVSSPRRRGSRANAPRKLPIIKNNPELLRSTLFPLDPRLRGDDCLSDPTIFQLLELALQERYTRLDKFLHKHHLNRVIVLFV